MFWSHRKTRLSAFFFSCNHRQFDTLAKHLQCMLHLFDLGAVQQIYQPIYLGALHPQPARQLGLGDLLLDHGIPQCSLGRSQSRQPHHRLARCCRRWQRYGNSLIHVKGKRRLQGSTAPKSASLTISPALDISGTSAQLTHGPPSFLVHGYWIVIHGIWASHRARLQSPRPRSLMIFLLRPSLISLAPWSGKMICRLPR